MKFQEFETITNFITRSFTDGRVIRELRLTVQELTYVKETYPDAKIERLSGDISSQKKWYRINIKPMLSEKSFVKV